MFLDQRADGVLAVVLPPGGSGFALTGVNPLLLIAAGSLLIAVGLAALFIKKSS